MAPHYLHANPAMTLLPALAFGFVLGVRHATDADHIAAVGTLAGVGDSGRRAALVGAAWGVGHSVSVLLVGGALVLLRLPMPVRLALALEFLVALMLIGLGIRSLTARNVDQAGSATRPLLVGVMHGLAGSAVLALLVIGTTTTALAAALYLLCFCLGTIGGMALVTALLTLPTRWRVTRSHAFGRRVRLVAGAASVILGVLIAHRVGVRDGLFAATPTWSP
jgi:high-affinity nickel permease